MIKENKEDKSSGITDEEFDSLLENNFPFAKRAEGLRLKPYRCPAGKLTIGYGRNLEDNGITEAEANSLLLDDLVNANNLARTLVVYQENLPDSIRLVQITVWQQIVTDMAFNLGKARLAKFKKFLKALDEYQFNDAIVEMIDSQWFSQVGNRAKLLVIAGSRLCSLGYDLDSAIEFVNNYLSVLGPRPEWKKLDKINLAFYYELYQWYLARLAKLTDHKKVVENLPKRFKKELDKALELFTNRI